MTEVTRRRKLNFEKCEYCRKDKQKCTPTTRTWPERKCDWCSKQGLPCGPNLLPDRFKRRKQDDASGSEPLVSSDSPIAMAFHETKQQELPGNFNVEQLIPGWYPSRSVFLLRTLDGAMTYDHREIIKQIVQDKGFTLDLSDSPHAQERTVKLVDLAVDYDDAEMIELTILRCSRAAFENTLQQRGTKLLDWAYAHKKRNRLFRTLLYWEILYEREDDQTLLLRTAQKRYLLVGVEIARLLLQFSGIDLDADSREVRKEGDVIWSTPDDGSQRHDCNDHILPLAAQIDHLKRKAVRKGDHTHLPLPPVEIPTIYLFHLSLQYGHQRAAKQLLRNPKLNVMFQDQHGLTVLHRMASNNIWEYLLDPLLAHPKMNINATDQRGFTPLILACAAGSRGKKVLDALLRRKDLYVNAQSKDGTTALHAALQKYGNETETNKIQLLDHPDIRLNLKDNDGNTPLLAVLKNTVPLHAIEIVQLLLKQKGIDFNAQNHQGQTALHLAIEHQDRPVVRSILEHSAVDINVRDFKGSAAISWVAFRGDVDYLTGLLRHDKIDVNTRNNAGMTPLMISAWRENVELVRLLCAQVHIDINAQDNRGKTALHYATEQMDCSMSSDMSIVTLMVKLLLSDERTQWLSDYEGNLPKVPDYLKKKYPGIFRTTISLQGLELSHKQG